MRSKFGHATIFFQVPFYSNLVCVWRTQPLQFSKHIFVEMIINYEITSNYFQHPQQQQNWILMSKICVLWEQNWQNINLFWVTIVNDQQCFGAIFKILTSFAFTMWKLLQLNVFTKHTFITYYKPKKMHYKSV